MSIVLIPVDADSTALTSAASNDTLSGNLIAIQIFPETLNVSSCQEPIGENNETMNMFLLAPKPPDTEVDSQSNLQSLSEFLVKPSSDAKREETLVTPQNIQKPFKCEFCNKKFVLDKTLEMHSRVHSSQSSISMNENKCSEKSNDDNSVEDKNAIVDACANLSSYIPSNIQGLEKPFKCNKCPERFLLKTALKKHNDIHVFESYQSSIITNDSDGDDDKANKKAVESVSLDASADLSAVTPSDIEMLEKPFACKKCGEKFLLKSSLKKHCDTHLHDSAFMPSNTEMLEKPFECKKCGERFLLKSSLKKHSDIHLNTVSIQDCYNNKMDEKPRFPSNIFLEKPFVCKKCGERFFLKTSLEKHNQIHVSEYCDSFVTENDTDNSVCVMYTENSNNDNKTGEKGTKIASLDTDTGLASYAPSNIPLEKHFECKKCGERFFFKTSLTKHDSTVHLLENYHSSLNSNDTDNESENSYSDNNRMGDKALECTSLDICADLGSDISGNIQAVKKPFECKKCGNSFLLKTSLKKHNRIHLPESRSSVSTNDIDNSVHTEETYVCDRCGRILIGKKTFEVHFKTHTERRRNHECDICERKFRSIAVLQSHMLLHTKGMIYICHICKESFFAKGILEAHLTKHPAVKPYVCEVCKKSFRNLGHLKEHRRIHTGERPYVCSVCQKSFTVKNSLTVHMRIHTGEKPYRCPICNFLCISSSALKVHVMTH